MKIYSIGQLSLCAISLIYWNQFLDFRSSVTHVFILLGYDAASFVYLSRLFETSIGLENVGTQLPYDAVSYPQTDASKYLLSSLRIKDFHVFKREVAMQKYTNFVKCQFLGGDGNLKVKSFWTSPSHVLKYNTLRVRDRIRPCLKVCFFQTNVIMW